MDFDRTGSYIVPLNTRGNSLAHPVKITSDLRVIVAPDAPALTGAQALDLGKKLIERGVAAVAREAVGYPQRGRRVAEQRAS